jgi:hydrogenase maturation protein HypF
MKNTFCLTREQYAFLSQHIGEMENYETLRFFEAMVKQLERTFRVTPQVIGHDLHPAYLSTRYALSRPGPHVPVQHHHAHVAGCMAENGLTGERPVIGVAFDGTGYGSDGNIWGGEFLLADYRSFRRVAHLKNMPLPGGDAAIRRPYRTALAYLWAANVDWEEDLPPVAAAPPGEREILARQLERGLNVIHTSSAGRLFDAVSALAGVRQEINYEAQAAIELEMRVKRDVTEGYAFGLGEGIDPGPVLHAVVADVRAGVEPGAIAARFHNGMASMIHDVCHRFREESGLQEVALSGGVFQNVTLLAATLRLLRESGFTVYTHRLVPPNDGGLALGQAVVAGVRFQNPEEGVYAT